jgi:hypothetical protein
MKQEQERLSKAGRRREGLQRGNDKRKSHEPVPKTSPIRVYNTGRTLGRTLNASVGIGKSQPTTI